MRKTLAHTRRVAAVLGAIGLIGSGLWGCTGNVGDDDDGAGAGPPGTPSGQDPGRVTMHRLNRAEYNNSVRDLLGTSTRPADDFPADDHSYGFDNIADTLTLSPLQLELYERSAETLTEEALGLAVLSSIDRFEAEDVGGSAGGATDNAWNLYSAGDVTVTQTLPEAGDYVVRVRAWQDAAGPDAAHMTLTVGGMIVGSFDVEALAASPVTIEQTFQASAGNATVMVSFDNDFYDEATSADRNLYIDYIEIEGPVGATGNNPLRDKLLSCEPAEQGEDCTREFIETFVRRVYRRSLEDAEVESLLDIYRLALDAGDDENEGLKLVMRAALTSPHFLYRVEIDPDPTSLEAHPLSAFELASRLSYFLWSSTPDDTLLDLAASDELLDPSVLAEQVDRMLDDPKSVALVDNFAGQWLFTRALADKTPDYLVFAEFDEELRTAMKAEADLFFAEFLKQDGPSLDKLIDSDFTYLNDRLAQHYGLGSGSGDELQRTSLDSKQRGGLLRQGSWLTVTSNPDRTSPVKRGKWILENLLCDAPPPPPPGVEGFKPEDLQAETQRELLAQHRNNPACSGCHSIMDPLGLAMENYDGIGRWRTEDKGSAIDASGEFEDEAFQTQEQFIALLVADPRLTSCATEKVFTYALGRAPDKTDEPYLVQIDEDFQADGMTLRSLFKLIVQSEPFRYRHGEQEGGDQ